MASARMETRSQDSPTANGTILSGYAARFNSPAIIAGAFVERIAPGAFSRSLRSRDVVALIGHDHARVLGRKSSGTLTLREDRQGLAFTLDVDPTTPDGQTALGTVGRRDVKGCSFGFQVLGESWRETDDLPERTLEEIALFEITLTAFPAYDDTSVGLRTLEAHQTGAARRVRMKAELEQKIRGLI